MEGEMKVKEIFQKLLISLKTNLASRLNRKFLFWFLIISLVPLAIISYLNHLRNKSVLLNHSYQELEVIGNISTERVRNFLQQITIQVDTQSLTLNTISAIQAFKQAFKQSGKNAAEFVKSYQWAKIKVQQTSDLKNFQRSFGFHDVYLIDTQGNILYSAYGHSELGKNLFSTELKDTNLSKAAKKVLTDGSVIYADIELKENHNNDHGGILLQIIVSEEGEKLGLLGVQVSQNQLDEILGKFNTGSTGETYLVGKDGYLRSQSRFIKERTIFKFKVQEETIARCFTGKESQLAHHYTNYRGIRVLGTFHPLIFGKTKFCLLSEINEDEILEPTILSRKISSLAFIITGIIVTFVAFFVSMGMTKPIRALKEWAFKVAEGDLTGQKVKPQKNELGDMTLSFKKVVESFRTVMSQADNISNGNFDIEITPRSFKDEMSFALAKMIENLKEISKVTEAVAAANFSVRATVKGEHDILSISLNTMIEKLDFMTKEQKKEDWAKSSITGLSEVTAGDLELGDLAHNIVGFICKYFNAQVGALYVNDKSGSLSLVGTYAYQERKNLSNHYKIGEGLVGQAALEKETIILSNIPKDYIHIHSGLGETVPKNIIIIPFMYNNQLKGVIELGSLKEFNKQERILLEQIASNIAIAINTSQARTEINQLLSDTKQQAQNLQEQQEELKTANEELLESEERLKSQQEELKTANEELEESQERLKSQQEELKTANEELEEKNESLEIQKKEIDQKNHDLELIKNDLQQKAQELEISGKYKSEFLANMSHELRTPLNSLLILAQNLSKNKKKNLTDDQIDSLKIIYNSGNDLLSLINDILDISKIEAGKLTISIEKVKIESLIENIQANFRHQFEEKGLGFHIEIDQKLPKNIETDPSRLNQVIKNLLSNSLKFTSQGKIKIKIERPNDDINLSRSGLDHEQAIAIKIADTGIGIPKNKQNLIFEAFQQADGSISRKHGGTGLGLSICRELLRLLGGEIQLSSTEGSGSTFTVFIPEKLNIIPEKNTESSPDQISANVVEKLSDISVKISSEIKVPSIQDDRDDIKEKDRTILIIEDDQKFAKVLYNFCHEKSFKVIHAPDGERGLEYARKYLPDAIILDIRLPGIQGWTVLEEIKQDLSIRHIPVHIMSVEDHPMEGLKKGAIGHMVKPVNESGLEEAFKKIGKAIAIRIKNLLIIEDDVDQQIIMKQLLESKGTNVTIADSGKSALEKIKHEEFDCIIIDLGLPDISGYEVLEQIDKMDIAKPPVIVHTGQELSQEQIYDLQKHASSIVIKGAFSQERLLDEVSLILHKVVEELPRDKKNIISKLYDQSEVFKGKKILFADDDMRNVFAISQLLEDQGMIVFKASDGEKALEILEKEKDIDLILMDIMMPVMDGLQAMEIIRESKPLSELPIIALTAKVLKGDRDKCIQAGANDYIPKPVDSDKLLSLMKMWLYK